MLCIFKVLKLLRLKFRSPSRNVFPSLYLGELSKSLCVPNCTGHIFVLYLPLDFLSYYNKSNSKERDRGWKGRKTTCSWQSINYR